MHENKEKDPGPLPDEELEKSKGLSPKKDEKRNEATIPGDRGNWERKSTTQGSE